MWPEKDLPTLAEFISRVEGEFGGRVEETAMTGPQGEIPLRYLVREVEGESPHFAIIPDIPMDARLRPNVMSTMCVHLGLSVGDFGFTLIL